MFTGIVEEIGDVVAVEPEAGELVKLTIGSSLSFAASLSVGNSVSVSGCCLTVVARKASGGFEVELMAETLAKTAPHWRAGTSVNLERAMQVGGTFGGHVVSGHVDGVAEVVEVWPEPGAHLVRLRAPEHLAGHLVPKGSVALDGVSLTLVDVGGAGGSRPEWPAGDFSVSLIPHTLQVTTLADMRPGAAVNIETDMLAKHVERQLALREAHARA
ncbi:MAG TPA: riboflavin synthase [Trueperaceae bacterium]|nr:riboflavin synthase [Trueperaceae bacterium]